MAPHRHVGEEAAPVSGARCWGGEEGPSLRHLESLAPTHPRPRGASHRAAGDSPRPERKGVAASPEGGTGVRIEIVRKQGDTRHAESGGEVPE